MKAYDEDAKYILFINKSITILGCSTVNSLTIDFLGHISQHRTRIPCIGDLRPSIRGMHPVSMGRAMSNQNAEPPTTRPGHPGHSHLRGS